MDALALNDAMSKCTGRSAGPWAAACLRLDWGRGRCRAV